MPQPQETVDRMGLTIRAEFVPFSRSRNANNPPKPYGAERSLNWRVTLLMQRGVATAPTAILTTDYSAGIGHCPSYRSKVPSNWPNSASMWQHDVTAFECENGKTARYALGMFSKGNAIEPKALDVIASLIMDSSVLDESSFEDWASSLGYDTDSRSAETIYRACLEIALKLRNGIGEAALADLREAFQDY